MGKALPIHAPKILDISLSLVYPYSSNIIPHQNDRQEQQRDSALLHLAITDYAAYCRVHNSLRPGLRAMVDAGESAYAAESLSGAIAHHPTGIDVSATLHSTSTLVTQK